MKKYYKIRKRYLLNSNFISFELIENDIVVKSNLYPDRKENRESVSNHLEKKGYVKYEKADHSN